VVWEDGGCEAPSYPISLRYSGRYPFDTFSELVYNDEEFRQEVTRREQWQSEQRFSQWKRAPACLVLTSFVVLIAVGVRLRPRLFFVLSAWLYLLWDAFLTDPTGDFEETDKECEDASSQ